MTDTNQMFQELTRQTQTLLERLTDQQSHDAVKAMTQAWTELSQSDWSNPTQWVEKMTEYQRQQMQLWQHVMGIPSLEPDRRFNNQAWDDQPVYDFIKQSYLLTSDMLNQWADSVPGDEKDKEKLKFYTQAYIDAMSPTNFAATNPEVIQEAMESNGQSLLNGWKNLLADLEKGRITMTDEAAFEVGENLATTPGAVIYQNDLFELIQYAPGTDTVNQKPLLVVPPCINKFYILDLGSGNSFVEWAVAQGNTLYMISWVNPDASHSTVSWDDYVERGVIQAMNIVREQTGQKKLNAISWCVGGTLLSCALGVLQKRRKAWVDSATFLTTLLDFSDPGQLSVFLDPDEVAQREEILRKEGVFSGKSLSLGFNLLRSNDLIWSYVVNNYLKGKTPPPFDILYWNSDPTNLPADMYCQYIRRMYLDNALQAGQFECCGHKIELSKVKVPCYFLSAIEDHIAPWKTTFAGTELMGGDCTFVLGGSGHIAGVINPPHKNKRNYWSNGELGQGAEHWQQSAENHAGSWWPHWNEWLQQQGNKQVDARAIPNDNLGPAPGEYVKKRI